MISCYGLLHFAHADAADYRKGTLGQVNVSVDTQIKKK